MQLGHQLVAHSVRSGVRAEDERRMWVWKASGVRILRGWFGKCVCACVSLWAQRTEKRPGSLPSLGTRLRKMLRKEGCCCASWLSGGCLCFAPQSPIGGRISPLVLLCSQFDFDDSVLHGLCQFEGGGGEELSLSRVGLFLELQGQTGYVQGCWGRKGGCDKPCRASQSFEIPTCRRRGRRSWRGCTMPRGLLSPLLPRFRLV